MEFPKTSTRNSTARVGLPNMLFFFSLSLFLTHRQEPKLNISRAASSKAELFDNHLSFWMWRDGRKTFYLISSTNAGSLFRENPALEFILTYVQKVRQAECSYGQTLRKHLCQVLANCIQQDTRFINPRRDQGRP